MTTQRLEANAGPPRHAARLRTGRLLDWARAFQGPGQLDLISWQDTITAPDTTALRALLDGYVAASGPADVRADWGGLGASIGSGREYWSQISLTDTIRAIRFLIDNPGPSGPYNIAAPNPTRNREFATALGHELRRPVPFRLPIWALRLAACGLYLDR